MDVRFGIDVVAGIVPDYPVNRKIERGKAA